MALKTTNKNRKKVKITKTKKFLYHLSKNADRYYFAILIIGAIFIYF
jgi:hypothetical protein